MPYLEVCFLTGMSVQETFIVTVEFDTTALAGYPLELWNVCLMDKKRLVKCLKRKRFLSLNFYSS